VTILLAIDTSIGTSVTLSVGDVHGGTATFGAGSPATRGHTEAIGRLIAQVFDEAQRFGLGTTPADVTGVVVGIGPGPFTGLRVGIAAAQAFAVARGVPLLPVSGHEAVALSELPDHSDAPPLRVLQDAKRQELFVTEYAGIDAVGLPVLAAPPRLLARNDYHAEPRDVWPERIPSECLVHAAELRLRAGRAFAPPQALYLRHPDIYPPATPKRVST